MKRRLFVLITAAALVFCIAPAVALADTGTDATGISWDYTLDGSSNATLTKCNTALPGGTDLVIPSVIDAHPVTTLGTSLFDDNGNLATLEIPDSVTGIGDRAFFKGNLTRVTIHGCITDVGSAVFAANNDLKTVTIEGGLSEISPYMFSQNVVLESLTISGVQPTKIGDHAFQYDFKLVNFQLPAGITSIGEWAFYDTAFTGIMNIPAQCTSIGNQAFFCFHSNIQAFNVDPANPNYCSDVAGALFNKAKTELICFPSAGSVANYTIPNTVTSISQAPFLGAKNLKKITFESPAKVTTAPEWAFSYSGLEEAVMPASVSSFSNHALFECHSLKKLTILCKTATFGGNVIAGDKVMQGIYGYAGSTAQTYAAAPGTNPSSVPFYAICTVAFDTGGGSTVGDMYPETDKVFTVPTDPTLTGYAFDGWYRDAAFGTKWDFGTDMPTDDMTLHAKWTANTYTVKYNANGGSGTMADSSLTYDVSSNLRTNSFSRAGYTFAGWTDTAGGTVAQYTDGQSVKNLSDVDGDVITLYAKWTGNSFTLTFDAQGGAVSPAAQSVTYGTAVGTMPVPTKDEFGFGGWYTAPDGAGAHVTETTVYQTADNTILYAKWSGDSFLIHYNLNGGTNHTANPASYTYGTGFTLSPPTREGYIFGGWFTESVFHNKVTSISSTQTGDMSLYANWLPVELASGDGNITLDLSGVTLPDGVTGVSLGSDSVPSSDGRYAAVEGLIGDNQGLVLYNLNLLDQNGTPIAFTSTIKVKIKISNGMSGDLRVYWYDSATQTLTDVNATVEDGWLVFETSHFSLYGVAQIGDPAPAPTPTPTIAPSPIPASGNPGIPGLPQSFTMYAGGRVTWTPGLEGGTWYWDENFFFVTADTPPTFTALYAGTTTVNYTVGWASQEISVTINESRLPQTGQDETWIWIVSIAACAALKAGLLIGRKRRSRER